MVTAKNPSPIRTRRRGRFTRVCGGAEIFGSEMDHTSVRPSACNVASGMAIRSWFGDEPRRMASNLSTTEAAESGRFSGFFARSSAINSASIGGSSGFSCRAGIGSSLATAIKVPIASSAFHGKHPVLSRYSTQPRLNKSARPSTRRVLACSGAMYAGLPTIVPNCVNSESSSATRTGRNQGSLRGRRQSHRARCLPV